MPEYHDPYLNTVKRTLKDKENKEKKESFKQKDNQNATKAFLDQDVELPEKVNNMLGIGMIALVPYLLGVLFIFVIVAGANIETYRQTDMTSYLLAWTIGYELIAIFLLLFIVKSAFSFRKNTPPKKD